MSNHLGRFLLSAGLIDRSTLSRALEAQHRRGCALVVALVVEGLLDEEDLYELHVFRGRFETGPESLVIAVSVQAMSLLPAEIAERFWVVPVRVSFDGSGARLLYLATTDPEDSHSLSELAAYTDSKVIPLVARFSKIGEALNHWYGIDVPEIAADKPPDTLSEGGPATRPVEAVAEPFAVDIDFATDHGDQRDTTTPEATAPDAAPTLPPPEQQPPAAKAGPTPGAGAFAQAAAEPGTGPAAASEANPFNGMPRPQLRMTSMHGDLDGDRPEPEAVPPHVAAWAGFNRLQSGNEDGPEPVGDLPPPEAAMPGADTLDDSPSGEVMELQESDLLESVQTQPEEPEPEPQEVAASADAGETEEAEEAEGAEEEVAAAPDGPPVPNGPTPQEAAELIRNAETRDAAVAAALDAMGARFKRALLFIAKPDVVQGYDVRGMSRERVRGIRVPLKIPSMFKDVRDTGNPFLDVPGKGSAHAVFQAAMGGDTGQVLLLPVHARGKVSLMLYADAPGEANLGLSASDIGAWSEVARALGDLVDALLAKRQSA